MVDVTVPPPPDPAHMLAEIRRWAERNEPTRWDLPPAPGRAFASVPPLGADPLWFRIQYVYAPVVVTRPESILKVSPV